MKHLIVLIAFLASFLNAKAQDAQFEGFFDFKWEEDEGKVMLDVTDRFDEEFLYVNSLSSGVGSNDIGLDRNQLGSDRIVKFVKSGPKVLMVQPNYRYRAVSDNPGERLAVEQAFAQSAIWGFTAKETDGKIWIDLTSFLLRDAHGVAGALDRRKQGTYSVDKSRSAVYLDRTKAFPDNSEFDAIITLTGKPKGSYITSVTPTATAVSVHMHHSFVRLPDDNYQQRKYDPRSGFNTTSYYDYATPIDQPLEKHFINRHRLEKKDPDAELSEAIEPIIYYIDPGCPEPIKSALMEGASWWNQAYEAAGYRDAFQVRELPEGADPLDVRYNMINWVHRSTRGWSYGSSVVDPRTGEIIKGHVLLGSLRVRQDYMIAQGLLSLFEQGNESAQPMVEMALARLRQLSAHEVGHTIGLRHNFAASYNDRSSVMDYPHPYIQLKNGELDFADAYDSGIGEWDKRMIIYGYSDFPEGTNEDEALNDICDESTAMGLKFMSDTDSRPQGGGHPYGHLWDNGEDAIDELNRLQEIRAHAMAQFGEETVPAGTYMAYLEQVLVPLYLNHRYQVEAVAKLIGGVDYAYNLRGDAQHGPTAVPRDKQLDALDALLSTLEPEYLAIDKRIAQLIPPHPAGISRNRELFDTHTGLFFDPLAAAESSVSNTMTFALHPQRLARLINQKMYDPDHLGLSEYMDALVSGVVSMETGDMQTAELKMMAEKQLVEHLIMAAARTSGQAQVSASALFSLDNIVRRFNQEMSASGDASRQAHLTYIQKRISDFKNDPAAFEPADEAELPPGSPIGCTFEY